MQQESGDSLRSAAWEKESSQGRFGAEDAEHFKSPKFESKVKSLSLEHLFNSIARSLWGLAKFLCVHLSRGFIRLLNKAFTGE